MYLLTYRLLKNPYDFRWLFLCNLETVFRGGENKVPVSRMWPVSRAVSNRGPASCASVLCAKCVARGWREQCASASLPGCQALLFIQSDSSAWVRPLFSSLPISSPSFVTLPWKTQTQARVHISAAQHRASPVHRYTYVQTITGEGMVQSVPSLFLSAAVFPSFYIYIYI